MWGSESSSTRGPRLGLHRLCVAVAKPALGRHLIPDDLLQFLDVGETSMLLTRPEELAVESDFEHATGIVGDEGHRTEFLGKCGEEFLRHPRGPEQPAALPAIRNGDVRGVCFSTGHARSSGSIIE